VKKLTLTMQDDDGPNKHLRIVITDHDPDDNVLVVHITTYFRQSQDPSCILDKGDHHCINRPSCVRYDKAIELNRNKVLRDGLNRIITSAGTVSDEVLKKLQDGAQKTSALPRKFNRYFQYF